MLRSIERLERNAKTGAYSARRRCSPSGKGSVGEGRIVPASTMDLAQARLGVAVRAGAPKPDIRTVEAYRQMLLRSRSINAVSTTGLYLTEKLLPQLGIAAEVTGKVKKRDRGGHCQRRSRDHHSPVSELVNVPGVDFAGPRGDSVRFHILPPTSPDRNKWKPGRD